MRARLGLRHRPCPSSYCTFVIQAISKSIDLPELAYRCGFGVAQDAALIRAAALQEPLLPQTLDHLRFAAEQVFPLTAADLMPALKGAALGDALKKAEARWIASGFELTKAELLD